MPLPVSVQICTLNEQANIGECLRSVFENDPQEVLVIDADSSDQTREIAAELGATVINAGRIGLARQRRQGYLASSLPYVAFVDADDRLDGGWLATMLAELKAGDYAALQSCLRTPDGLGWWSDRWNDYFIETVQPCADTIMVGRPALLRSDALRGIQVDDASAMEDTAMSKDFQDRGLRQGIGTAVSRRLSPTTRAENVAKWRSYGRGYREFVQRHPDRRSALLRHMLVTIPIVRGMKPVLRGSFSQPYFGVEMSANMLIGWMSARSH